MEQLEDNNIVIRYYEDKECTIQIIGEDPAEWLLKFKPGTPSIEMLRELNRKRFWHHQARIQVREKCFDALRGEVKKRAGIKRWQFWKKAPQHLRDRMNDLVAKVAAEMPQGSTYEQITEEIIKQYNQCDNVGRLGHECDQHCFG